MPMQQYDSGASPKNQTSSEPRRTTGQCVGFLVAVPAYIAAAFCFMLAMAAFTSEEPMQEQPVVLWRLALTVGFLVWAVCGGHMAYDRSKRV